MLWRWSPTWHFGRRVGAERVDLLDAFHRVLAEDVAADIDMPPFHQSTRDGFACRRADLGNDLNVVETVAAGTLPRRTLGPNDCAKIMTGAAIPSGADCVVMLEQVEHLGDTRIRCLASSPEDYICPQGAHATAGETLLLAGERIEAPHIAVLAGVGCSRPLVSRRPTVGVIATGSELVEPELQTRTGPDPQQQQLPVVRHGPCGIGRPPQLRPGGRRQGRHTGGSTKGHGGE